LAVHNAKVDISNALVGLGKPGKSRSHGFSPVEPI
jgi:hypothetical protein